MYSSMCRKDTSMLKHLIVFNIAVSFYVTLFRFISISMVFLNKYLLSSDDLKVSPTVCVTVQV